jgi:glutathione S-transferase
VSGNPFRSSRCELTSSNRLGNPSKDARTVQAVFDGTLASPVRGTRMPHFDDAQGKLDRGNMTLKIYGVPRSRATRTLWMAHELGISFELIEVPPGAEGSRKPEYLRLNPNGQVPFIDDHGLILWESMAINLYLAKKHGAPIGPANLAEDGQMTMWGFWTVNEIEPHASTVLYNTAERPEAERSSAALTTALNALNTPLMVLEKKLQEGSGYLVGRRFTVTDLNAISCLFYLRFAPQALADKPAIRAWYDEGMARPANRAAFALRGD